MLPRVLARRHGVTSKKTSVYISTARTEIIASGTVCMDLACLECGGFLTNLMENLFVNSVLFIIL